MNSITDENNDAPQAAAANSSDLFLIPVRRVEASSMPNRARRRDMHKLINLRFNNPAYGKPHIVELYFDFDSQSMVIRMPDERGFRITAEEVGKQLYAQWSKDPETLAQALPKEA